MIDNVDVAVFTRLNELAERHGFKPYEFIAGFRPEKGEGTGYVLAFEVPPQGEAREQRFDKMLDDIGVDDGGAMKGSPKEIFDALDNALLLAPRPRRGR
jgi:hypothetical protein